MGLVVGLREYINSLLYVADSRSSLGVAFLILSIVFAPYNRSFVHGLFVVEGAQRRKWGVFGWNDCRCPSAQSRRRATDESAARRLIADALSERVVGKPENHPV